jgi:hypothetical protein
MHVNCKLQTCSYYELITTKKMSWRVTSQNEYGLPEIALHMLVFQNKFDPIIQEPTE